MIGLVERARPPLVHAALAQSGRAAERLPEVTDALERLASERVSALVLETTAVNDEALELLAAARSRCVPVLVVARDRSVGAAVDALRAGATDYLAAPFELESLGRALDRLEDASRAGQPDRDDPHAFVTADPETRETLDLVASVAATDATILVEGESGTGKELLAQRVHRLSPRGSRELVSINCAALPPGLLESELFGHERGAFTGAFSRVLGKFELAGDTTILLDEIGELELGLQAKLLRVVQEKRVQRLGARAPISVDFRLVATTNRDLAAEVRAGRFREDLFYRLNVIPVRIKPLRKRRDDVPLLLHHFMARFARCGRPLPELAPDAVEALRAYAWPGNARELENLVERLALTAAGRQLGPNDLGLGSLRISTEVSHAPGDLPFRSIREMERWLIVETLRRLEGNRTRASRDLGISLRTLRNKINDYRIDDPDTLPRTGTVRPRQISPGGP